MRKVNWTIRDDGNSMWGIHYRCGYVLFVTDRDGDFTDWEIWRRADSDKLAAALSGDNEKVKDDAVWRYRALAKGEVYVGMNEFEIGQATAIECLDAIIRDDEECTKRQRQDEERNAGIERRRAAKKKA